MKLEIRSFLDIQKYQKLYNIPFTTSISAFTYKLINHLYSEGEEEIEIIYTCDIIPKTYRKNPWSWASLILEKRIDYDNFRAFRNTNSITLKASKTEIIKRSFRPLLLASLQKRNRIAFPFLQIPYAYKKQPYYLVSLLRKEFPSLSITITDTHIIYTHNEKITEIN